MRPSGGENKISREDGPYNSTPVVSAADILHALTVVLYSTTVFAPGLLLLVVRGGWRAWRNGIQFPS